MDRRTRTYSWFLLLVFVLGGVVVPALHFNQHTGAEREARPISAPTAADAVIAQASDAGDYVDCTLCNARLLASALVSLELEIPVYVEVTSPYAPQRLALGMIGNTSDRGPPAVMRG